MSTGVSLTVPPYDPLKGAVAPVEGGNVTVTSGHGEFVISGDRIGLLDLARWCMALADPTAPDWVHVHLDPNVIPLTSDSLPLTISRMPSGDRGELPVE